MQEFNNLGVLLPEIYAEFGVPLVWMSPNYRKFPGFVPTASGGT
jgi:hypothetical protein